VPPQTRICGGIFSLKQLILEKVTTNYTHPIKHIRSLSITTLAVTTLNLSSLSSSAAVSVGLDFENGTWVGAAANGANSGWLGGALTGSLSSNGIAVDVTFGTVGGASMSGSSPAYANAASHEGFTLGSSSSEAVDQNGNNLGDYIFMELEFSEPAWIDSWTVGDIDAFWQAPNDREWIDEVHVEGWSTPTVGAVSTGIQSVWSGLGAEIFDLGLSEGGVSGVRSTFTTNGAPANDVRNQATFSLGSEAAPIRSLRLYFVSAGNVNVSTGHNIVLQESLPQIQAVPEVSSLLLSTIGSPSLVLLRRR